jgi:hypothetical protein
MIGMLFNSCLKYVTQVSKSKCEKEQKMSQAKDRPFPCSMYKENFDKNTREKKLGLNN